MSVNLAASRIDTNVPTKPSLEAMEKVQVGGKRARALSPSASSRVAKVCALTTADGGKENVRAASPTASPSTISIFEGTSPSMLSSRAASNSPSTVSDAMEVDAPLCDVGCKTVDDSIPRCPHKADSVATTAPAKTVFERLQGKVIEVEGNIGSGKSTLTRNLSDLVQRDTADAEYSIVHGEKVNTEFLKAFYENTTKYAFAFQMYMLTTRLYQMDESYRQAEKENKLVFLDRGAVGDVLFALQNYRIGNMNDLDMQVYKSVCTERLPKSLSDRVDAVLYLDVSPEVCWYRMTTVRQREAEEGVPLSYLEGIDSVYFHLLVDWIGSRKGGFHDMNIGSAPPVLVVRWNKFGCTRDVLDQVADVIDGVRASPTVAFTLADLGKGEQETASEEAKSAVNRAYDAVFDSADSLAAAYKQLEEKDALPLTNIAVNWSLTHDTAFRRVVLYILSITGHVTFYGKDTATQTPTYNCDKKNTSASS